MKKLKGVVTAVPTMLDKSLDINVDWTKNLASFLLDREVDGLYPCGTTGEMLYLTTQERKLIAETILQTRNEKKSSALVYIHTGAARVDDTIELTLHAYSIGADGVGIVTPWYFRIDDLALFNFYDTIFKNVPSDFPVYVYNIPQLSGNDLKPSTIAQLKELYPNMVGIKYSYSDFNRLKEYVALKGVDVLVGPDVQMVESIVVGAVGTVSGLSSVYPELFCKIYKLTREEKLKEAITLQSYAYELGKIMHHGGNLSMFKYGLELRNFPLSVVKPPLRNLTNEEALTFTKALKNWEDRLRKAYPHLLVG